MTIFHNVMPCKISKLMLGWSCRFNFKGHIFGEIWQNLDIHTSLTISIHRNITPTINIRKLNIPGKSSIVLTVKVNVVIKCGPLVNSQASMNMFSQVPDPYLGPTVIQSLKIYITFFGMISGPLEKMWTKKMVLTKMTNGICPFVHFLTIFAIFID